MMKFNLLKVASVAAAIALEAAPLRPMRWRVAAVVVGMAAVTLVAAAISAAATSVARDISVVELACRITALTTTDACRTTTVPAGVTTATEAGPRPASIAARRR